MTDIERIRSERDSAMAMIEKAILDAPASAAVEKSALMAKRTEIAGAAFAAILASPDVAVAIAALSGIVTRIGEVIPHMQVSAEWLGRIADFLTLVDEVAEAVR
jgi:hypothetical protein